MKHLENKVAVITGAGRGWGQAIAVMFAREGAQTIVAARTPSEIERTVEMIRAENGKAEGICLDVSDDAAVRNMIDQTMKKYGCIDVMVNNAAILPLKTFEDATMEEVDRILDINLRAPMYICKLVIDIMKKQGGGSIINVSSSSGVKGFYNESIYCTAKHGLEGLTKAIAIECGQYNIAANTITPGGASANIHIKPTSITQAQFDAMPEEEKKKWGDPLLFTEAFVYLAMQRPNEGGISGERFVAYELSEHIRQKGYDIKLSDMQDEPVAMGKY